MPTERPDAQLAAGRLVRLARCGELELVVASLRLLTYSGAGRRERLRQILGALIEATAAITRARAAARQLSGVFGADLRRADESTVDIDTIDPPVRATIRALLAAVNDAPEDAADQVALAVAGGDRAAVEVVLLALDWTVNAVESCADCGVSPPNWLEAA